MRIPLRIVIMIASVIGFSLLAAGCGKKAAENTIESSIENSTNGQADVDIDDSSVSINVNGSSLNVGDSVALPTDFPTDIYVVDGTIKSALKIDQDQGFSVSLITSKTVAETKALYTTKLTASGWTLSTTATVSGNEFLGGTKDGRNISVTIGAEEGREGTVVSITTSSPTATLETPASE